MRLQWLKRIFRTMTLCVSLLFAVAWVGPVAADVYLDGEIKIGDNDYEHIVPNNMLQENWRTGVFEPVNPIHFNLSKSINLTEIQLKTAREISGSLYFVIWDKYNNVIVNRRSASFEFWRSQYSRQTLAAGDYKIAVVGQCFKRRGGSWRPEGWRNTCSSGNRTYDDFSFQGITLKTRHSSDTTRSLAFIQRHHIGDSEESRDNGYADRWYPDDNEGSRVDYDFTVPSSRKLLSVTIYHYRDLIAYGNTVMLKLINKDTARVIRQSTMSAASASGDYIWSLNESLIAGVNYGVVIQVTGWGDRDDISWDDVVVKMGPDTESAVDHYRIDHPVNALTCEPASITVKACTNAFVAGGSCEEATSTSDVTLIGSPDTAGEKEISQSLSFSGSTKSELAYTKVDTLTLSLRGIAPKQYYCNNSRSSDCKIEFADAGFKFSYGSGGPIANQVSGVGSSAIKLEAFYNDKGQCRDLFDNNKKIDVQLGFQCQDPGTCSGQAFTVDGVTLGRNNAGQLANYSDVRLTFDKNIAPLNNAKFQDAGQIILAAKYKIKDNSQGLKDVEIKGQSNAFWVKPDKFIITATDKDDENIQLDGSSASSSVIYSAAKPFTLSVTAVNRQGDATKNYQPVNAANIEGRVTRIGPDSGGVDGKFHYANNQLVKAPLETPNWSTLTGFTDFKKGVSEFTAAAYDEVGIIKFDLRDKDYQGLPIDVAGDGATIGRFTPDHFTLTESSVENFTGAAYDFVFPDGLKNYVAGTRVLSSDGNIYQCREFPNSGYCVQWSAGSNQYESGVGSDWQLAWILLNPQPPSGPGFTYMDQPELKFRYKLAAQNLDGKVTQNYIGDYNKAEIAKLAKNKVGFVAESDGLEATDRLIDFSGFWCDGIYQSGSCANYGSDTGQFSRLTTGPDGPFMNTYFGIKLEDTDKVKIVDLDMLPDNDTIKDLDTLPDDDANSTAKRLSPQKSELRYGRWTIAGGYGPINQPFPVSMQLEYFNGIDKGFVLNKDDSITTFNEVDASATFDYKNTNKRINLKLTGSGTFQDGFTQGLIIDKHSNIGDVLLIHTAPVWLQYDWPVTADNPGAGNNPSAIISFGFFRGNDRVIYRRRLN